MMRNSVFLPAIALGVTTIMLATPHVAAIDRHVVSFESSHLFPDADFVGDIDATKQSSDASDNPSRGNLADAASRSYGRIIAYPSFIQKMQKSMLGSINSNIISAIFDDADEGDASFQEVQTLHLTKTSARHVDCTMTVEGDKITNHPLKESDGLTSFYVQQADDAYLETDDDELCIPLVAGRAVSFNGGLPHRTVVNSGSVKLVGPFFLSSFASVGMTVFQSSDGGVMLLETRNPVIPCYTTIIEKEGELTLVSGHTKVQFKISEDDAGETRISSFTINGKDIGEAGVSLCQLAKFNPDIMCMKESLETNAGTEYIRNLWSTLFSRCADDTLNSAIILDQPFLYPTPKFNDLSATYVSTSNLPAAEGTKSGKTSTSTTADENLPPRRQRQKQSQTGNRSR